jgi:geranyl-CoA carboxylase beta subunit
MGVKKLLRAQTIALKNELPLITLTESAGTNLNHQSEIFVDGGRTFAKQARLSALGIPRFFGSGHHKPTAHHTKYTIPI